MFAALVIAFDKEHFPNPGEIEIFPATACLTLKNIMQGGEYRHFHPHVLCFKVLPRVLVCLLLVFDLLFAFGVLACLILDCASLLCGLLSGKLHALRLKSGLLAFGILRKLIDIQFLRFSGSRVSRSCIAFGVLAGCACLGKLRCLS